MFARTHTDSSPHPVGHAVILGGALLIYTALVFYRIDAKALWTDEVLVPLTARFPVDYILRRSLVTDFHPPGYYLLVKVWSLVSDHDGFLRALAALCGLAAVGGAYFRFGRLFSRDTGLFCAVLMATNPWFIALSRQVRPYTLLVLLCVLVLSGTMETALRGRGARAALLALAAGVLVHYEFLLLGVFLLPLAIPYGGRFLEAVRDNKLATALLVLATACSLFLLAHRMGETGHPGTLVGTAATILTCVAALFARNWMPDAYTWVMLALFLAGAAFFSRARRREAAILASYLFAPLLVLLLVRYSSYSNPWHYLYVLPAVCLVCAAPLARMAQGSLPRAAFLALVALVGSCVLVWRTPALYRDEGVTAKSRAAVLGPLAEDGAAFIVPDILEYNALDRYLPPARRRPFEAQRIRPDEASLTVVCVDGDYPLDGGRPEPADSGVRITSVSRTPALEISDQPALVTFSLTPAQFYARVHDAAYVQISPHFGAKLIPTANGVQARFAYLLTNNGPQHPYVMSLALDYHSAGLGNGIRVYTRFDDEARSLLFSTGDLDPRRSVPIPMVRQGMFRKLLLEVEMTCAPRTPTYPGGNLETVAIEGMRLYLGCYQ